MKNCKIFYEAKTASRIKEIIQPSPQPTPHQIKSYYISGTKIFLQRYTDYGDIQKYTDICFQSASKMPFLAVQKWCSANVFSDTKQKRVCWKICRVRKIFSCVAGAYYFQCQVN